MAPQPGQRSARAALGWAALVLALGGACGGGGGNSLGGTILDANFDLAFDSVALTSDGKSLSIRYSKAKTGEIPCQLAIGPADGVNLAAGGPLSIDYAHFQASTTLSRQMAPGTTVGATFPQIAGAAISFDEVSLTPGARVRGSFLIYFVDPGYTVRGEFDGLLRG